MPWPGFSTAVSLVSCFMTVFFIAAGFTAVLLAGIDAGFFAAGFTAVGFTAAGFAAGLAAGFFAAGFFAILAVDLTAGFSAVFLAGFSDDFEAGLEVVLAFDLAAGFFVDFIGFCIGLEEFFAVPLLFATFFIINTPLMIYKMFYVCNIA